MSKHSQTSKKRVHSKQFSTQWVTDIFQEGIPVVFQNGTLKQQTDYLFMCWFGGCFCPSCHTSISNVKGPHLGCVKMHHIHMEKEKKLSLLSVSEVPSLALALAVNSLESLHKYEPSYSKRKDPTIHLGVLEGENKQRMCSEWRWEVMCDGGRVQARKSERER